LIKSWSPDTVVHLGDIVYADGVVDPMTSDYEECVGQYFGADFVGGYNGPFGPGPPRTSSSLLSATMIGMKAGFLTTKNFLLSQKSEQTLLSLQTRSSPFYPS
jgi:hypothetical protein